MAKNINTPNHSPNKQPNNNRRKPSALRRAGAVTVTALALGGGIAGLRTISGGEDSARPQNPVETTTSQEQAKKAEFNDVEVFKDTALEFRKLTGRLSMNASYLAEKNLLGAKNVKFSTEDLEAYTEQYGESTKRNTLTFSREGGESITIIGTGDKYSKFNGDIITLKIEDPQDGLTTEYILSEKHSSYQRTVTFSDGTSDSIEIWSNSLNNNSSANVTFVGRELGADFSPVRYVNTLQSSLGTDLDILKLYNYYGSESQSGTPE